MTLWRRIFAERRSVLVPLVALLVVDAALVGAVVLPLKKVVANNTVAASSVPTRVAGTAAISQPSRASKQTTARSPPLASSIQRPGANDQSRPSVRST